MQHDPIHTYRTHTGPFTSFDDDALGRDARRGDGSTEDSAERPTERPRSLVGAIAAYLQGASAPRLSTGRTLS